MSTFKNKNSNNVKDGKILTFWPSKFEKYGTLKRKKIIKYRTDFFLRIICHDIQEAVSFGIF